MKKAVCILFAGVLFAVCSIYACAGNTVKVYMSAKGTLEANFHFSELIEKERITLYEDPDTGYKASVRAGRNGDNLYTMFLDFENGDAFFSFRADIITGDYQLINVHSKACNLPHRVETDDEYSSMLFGEIGYIDFVERYYTTAGYVTEIREFTRKGIIGQGVNLDVFKDGKIRIRRNVLDTDTKGGYNARSAKETIGSHSREIIIAVIFIGWVIKNISVENVAKNSARLINEKET